MRKTKGYITVYALIIGLFIFTIIGYLVISFSSNSKVNENSYEYLQGSLIAESINNKIIYENLFTEIFKENNNNIPRNREIKLYIDEFKKDFIIKINTVKPMENYILDYKVEYEKILLNGHTELIRDDKNPNYSLLNREDKEIDNYIDILKEIDKYYRPEDKYIFEYEKYLYEIDMEIYDYLYREYIGEALEEEIMENSNILEGDVLFDTDSIEFLERDINLDGIFIDRGNINLDNLELSGIYISKENTNIKSLNILGGIYCTDKFNSKFTYIEDICNKYYIDDLKEIDFKLYSFNIT